MYTSFQVYHECAAEACVHVQVYFADASADNGVGTNVASSRPDASYMFSQTDTTAGVVACSFRRRARAWDISNSLVLRISILHGSSESRVCGLDSCCSFTRSALACGNGASFAFPIFSDRAADEWLGS